MAEIKFDNLYDQLGLLDQKFYDSTFKNTYDPNKSQPMLEGKSGYDQMKAVYEAQQQVPEKSILDSINIFSSADAAIPDNQYGIGSIDMGAYYTPEQQALMFGDRNYLGTNTPQYYEGTTVPVANVGELLMNAGTTDFMDQFKTEPSVPQMSIEDQIQANIDRIQSTPGFEGYVPSGTPTQGNRPNMRDVAGDIDLNMTDLGNPFNDSRVVSEEQGLSGFPGTGQVDRGFQNVLDAREARAAQIANQQDPNYGQFFDPVPVNEKKGLTAGDALGILGLISGSNPIKAMSALANRQKIGRMLGNVRDTVSSGLGSLNKKMRGVDPYTGRVNTQADFDYNRNNRRTTNRINTIDKTLARWEANPTKYADKLKNTTLYDRRDNLRREQNKSNIAKAKSKGVNISSLNPNEMRNVSETGSPGGDSGSSKIVCTMMNERYGFGSFRNKIWMKFHENHGPEYQKGYHTIFLPLVKIAKGEGKLNTAVRKVLEHMGRHVTADMFKIMKGKKRDTLGRIYRAIFEPTCRIIGKIKSALGRG